MKLFLIAVLCSQILDIFVKLLIIWMHRFPYTYTTTIGEQTFEILVSLGICVWVSILLFAC